MFYLDGFMLYKLLDYSHNGHYTDHHTKDNDQNVLDLVFVRQGGPLHFHMDSTRNDVSQQGTANSTW